MSSEKSKKNTNKSPEEIFQGFQDLRNEQRKLVNKISEMEMDLNEHKIVADALGKVEEDRKCFRLINGILVERTVKEIKPLILSNRDQLEEAIKTLNDLLEKKGVELNEYKERYNIRLKGGFGSEQAEIPLDQSAAPANTGVLVDKA